MHPRKEPWHSDDLVAAATAQEKPVEDIAVVAPSRDTAVAAEEHHTHQMEVAGRKANSWAVPDSEHRSNYSYPKDLPQLLPLIHRRTGQI